MSRTKVKFTTVGIDPSIDPEGGYMLRLADQPSVDAETVIEEVITEKGLPMKPDMLKFAFGAVIETITSKMAKDCKPRRIGNLIKFEPRLRGKLKGPYDPFSSAEGARAEIGVRLLSGLERSIDRDYVTFVNAAAGETVSINNVLWIGGETPYTVKVGQPFAAYGKNLVFKPAFGDTAQFVYTDAQEQEHTVDLTVTVSDYDHIAFAWPEALADMDPGVELTLKLVSRAGIEGNEPTTNEKTVTVVA